MGRIAGRILTFFRWLSLPEELPASTGASESLRGNPKGTLRHVFAAEKLAVLQSEDAPPARRPGFTRWILSSERFPEIPDQERGEVPRARHIVTWLLSAETLPEPNTTPREPTRRSGALRSVLSPEQCPQDPTPPTQSRVGVLRRVLSAETCPDCTGPTERRSPGFLHWVSSSESCPRNQTPTRQRRAGFLHWLMSTDEL